MNTPLPLTPYWEEQLRLGNVKSLACLDFSEVKKSSTLFILCSGPSVNELTTADWDVVRGCDSVGFNYWLKHPFVPTYYGFEGVNDTGEEAYWAMVNEAAPRYSNVPWLVKDGCNREVNLNRFPASNRKNLYLSKEFLIGDSTKGSCKRHFYSLVEQGFFEPRFHLEVIPKRRSSVVYHLCLGAMLGYRTIVLIGCDLGANVYFASLPNEASGNPDQLHPLEDQRFGIPTSQVIEAFCENVADVLGIKVLIGSKSSKLYPFLRHWKDAYIQKF